MGGSDLGNNTRKVLKNLLSNDLAAQFSRKGKKGKLVFDNLKIYPIITSTSVGYVILENFNNILFRLHS